MIFMFDFSLSRRAGRLRHPLIGLVVAALCFPSPAGAVEISIDDVLNLAFENANDPQERTVGTEKLAAFAQSSLDDVNVLNVTLITSKKPGFYFDPLPFWPVATAFLARQDRLIIRVITVAEGAEELNSRVTNADINIYAGHDRLPIQPQGNQRVEIRGKCASLVTVEKDRIVSQIDTYVLGRDIDPPKMQNKVMSCFVGSFLRFAGYKSFDPGRILKILEPTEGRSSRLYVLQPEYIIALRVAMRGLLRPGMTRDDLASVLKKNRDILITK